MENSKKQVKKSKGKENKKFFDNKKLLILIAALVVIGVAIAVISGSFANEDIPVITETGVTLNCNDYKSFDGKLECTVNLKLARHREISGLSIKLSDAVSDVYSLENPDEFEYQTLTEGEYLDVIFDEDLLDDEYGVDKDIAKIYFDNIDEDQIITVADVKYYDWHAVEYEIDGSFIENPTESSKMPTYSLDVQPGSSILLNKTVDSGTNQYLFMPNYSGEDLFTEVQNLLLSDAWHMEGCNYAISVDGSSILIEDAYGDSKKIDVVYIGLKDGNEYTLSWADTQNVYTRSAKTDAELKKYCFDTNGYFTFDGNNHKVTLNAKSGNNYVEIETKDWYYISGKYNFNTGIINIAGTVSYDEFMNNISTYGVSIQGVDFCANDSCGAGSGLVSGEDLGKINKVEVKDVPGVGTDTLYVYTNPGFEINVNYKTALVDSDENNEYVIYDLDFGSVYDVLQNIEVTNGYFTVLTSDNEVRVQSMNFDDIEENRASLSDIPVATGDKLVIHSTETDTEFVYHLSILGDVDGSGRVNFSDVIKAYRMYKNTADYDESQKYAANVVVDSNNVLGDTIDTLDVQRLYGFYRGKYEILKYDVASE